MAPGKWPLAHSLSSRTSTSTNFSPASMRRLTSGTLVSLTRFFASFTMERNFGARAIGCLLAGWKLMIAQCAKKRRPKDTGRRYNESRMLQRLWLGGILPWFCSEGVHQVHQIPARFLFRAVTFATDHFSAAVGDDVEQFAVGVLGDGAGITPIF